MLLINIYYYCPPPPYRSYSHSFSMVHERGVGKTKKYKSSRIGATKEIWVNILPKKNRGEKVSLSKFSRQW